MNGVKKKKFRMILLTLIALFIVIGMILYLLANRYLIEHAEKVVTVTTSTAVVDENYSSDDWSYGSDSKTIKIQKVVKGSGEDKITYYVADVKVSDATQLASAFAKNEFGTNIIEYTSEIAKDQDAIFAINGDYYGFRSDGVVIRNGVLYRNEPARTGLAFFKDGSMKIYDEKEISAQELLDQGVWNTVSFGPALVEDGKVIGDFSKVQIDKNFGNRSIEASNPRTGVGIIDENHFIFVVVDGRSSGYSRGMTLDEVAQLFIDLGCTEAYNLDGGGSSTMYFNGRLVNNPLGKSRERGVSDILYIK
ncbi:phosphodiester glycosidase family protein [Clostridium cellulovorans]|uniref:Exopolysaccharide biosynthesis protein n=1 Tax=Clostridium cellulovorans (strain ATCC 35296 / DSM 3052 / OCM 3 / 743B) TaxID=573061 RepID=D9SPX9_CLOC7|nr:phosphodiester glycosidase family protein [Clostridium cellulovorans]ADL52115.1 exopolysaccharide biosynthesis protein [Clostridium cellulovorans 743B]